MRKAFIPVVDIPDTDNVMHLAACDSIDEATALADLSGMVLVEIETIYLDTLG